MHARYPAGSRRFSANAARRALQVLRPGEEAAHLPAVEEGARPHVEDVQCHTCLHIPPVLPPTSNIAAVSCPSEQYFVASISTSNMLLFQWYT